MKNLSVKTPYAAAALFFLAGLISLQIPFTQLLGSSVKFTAFDFFAPVAGAFLGTVPGILTILLAQLVNVFLHGGVAEPATFIRLIPTLFGVWYFAKKRQANLWVALAAMIAFNAHPIGRSAWQYSLFWLIPIAAHFYRDNSIVRSFGATFTTHAVGGAIWVWMFGLSQTIWLALIPQVVLERSLMAVGIAATYLVVSKLKTYAFFSLQTARNNVTV